LPRNDVFVDDSLVGNGVHAALGYLELRLRGLFVSGGNCLLHVLDSGTQFGALAGIVSGSGPTCAFLCTSAVSAVDVGTELSGAGVCRTVRVASGPVPGARVVPTPMTEA